MYGIQTFPQGAAALPGSPRKNVAAAVTAASKKYRRYLGGMNLHSGNSNYTIPAGSYPAPTPVCFGDNEVFVIGNAAYWRFLLTDGANTLVSATSGNFADGGSLSQLDVFNISASATRRISQGGAVVDYSNGVLTKSRIVPATGTISAGAHVGIAYSLTTVNQVLQKSDGGYAVTAKGSVGGTNYVVLFNLAADLTILSSRVCTNADGNNLTYAYITEDPRFGFVMTAHGGGQYYYVGTFAKDMTQINYLYNNYTSASALYGLYDPDTQWFSFSAAYGSTNMQGVGGWVTAAGAISAYSVMTSSSDPFSNIDQLMCTAQFWNHWASHNSAAFRNLRTADGRGLAAVVPPSLRANVSSSAASYSGLTAKRARVLPMQSNSFHLPEFEFDFSMQISTSNSYQETFLRIPVEIPKNRCVMVHGGGNGSPYAPTLEVVSLAWDHDLT